MTRQEAIAAGEEAFKTLHDIMDRFPAPFEDDRCNRRWARLRRRLEDVHGDITDCIKDGDPTAEFGGPK